VLIFIVYCWLTGPKRSTLQAMLVNLDGEDDMPALQSGSHSPPRSANADIDDNGRCSLSANTSIDWLGVTSL